ncbi:ribosomal L7Ae/L30e/S12e/Gadd45 family protein [Alicyclobacillus fastidiosus]|uniref:Ribosomal L7Ae/L30e/S12e/Gadd45 family protein n=1 Tax=Alicyclobacillus fastidiosus TaxID=392011 RepID=A0ABV5AK64_9BACL|nr:ribosomal L7Ae/L30e/S12e/Gadd45 family protein [Alicyclobacillus fastidiosus]WEH09988.1 ribosomal L7Ae/L30e/S12e/Gadd45 family protein [Alicyclobacillus fastidiosus]
MSLDDIRQARKKTIGTNQTLKVLKQSAEQIVRLYVARDAEARVIDPVVQLATKQRVPIEWVDTMRTLGKACGIEVGAATASIISE